MPMKDKDADYLITVISIFIIILIFVVAMLISYGIIQIDPSSFQFPTPTGQPQFTPPLPPP
jgi:hypothetical protein